MSASLTRAQRDKVTNFTSITGSAQKQAVDFLKRCEWSLNRAVDVFFSEGATVIPERSVPVIDSKQIELWYRRYKERESDAVGADGIQLLCDDIGITPLDPVILVLSYHCQASQMGVFTREEFLGGMQRLGCDGPEKLRAKIEEMRHSLNDKVACKEIYAFTFQFALDQGQRCLPLDMSVEFWKLLLRPHFAKLDDWLDFVDKRCRNAISKDTWMMLYDLATQVQPDLSDYDINDAWPVMIDDFVEFVKNKPAS
mmetsp:Transcript_53804/g.114876  ORF Transcript_53804/g.114876 Transcript_53804/m.114876 type:complete len:254 (+) Transcript_53804:111-872(+)